MILTVFFSRWIFFFFYSMYVNYFPTETNPMCLFKEPKKYVYIQWQSVRLQNQRTWVRIAALFEIGLFAIHKWSRVLIIPKRKSLRVTELSFKNWFIINVNIHKFKPCWNWFFFYKTTFVWYLLALYPSQHIYYLYLNVYHLHQGCPSLKI